MMVLLWVAVLVGGWCVASVATALIMGSFLRRRREATDPRNALRPLAVGPLDLWVGVSADIPDTPESLIARERLLPAPRSSADELARDAEGVA